MTERTAEPHGPDPAQERLLADDRKQRHNPVLPLGGGRPDGQGAPGAKPHDVGAPGGGNRAEGGK